MSVKKGGRDFPVGWKGGPGRPKDPPELHLIKQMTRAELRLMITKFMMLPHEELRAFYEDKTNNSLELALAQLLILMVRHGDQSRLNFIIEQLFGKLKEVHDLTIMGNVHAAVVDRIAEISKANSQQGGIDGKNLLTYEEVSCKEVVSKKDDKEEQQEVIS